MSFEHIRVPLLSFWHGAAKLLTRVGRSSPLRRLLGRTTGGIGWFIELASVAVRLDLGDVGAQLLFVRIGRVLHVVLRNVQPLALIVVRRKLGTATDGKLMLVLFVAGKHAQTTVDRLKLYFLGVGPVLLR